MKEKREISPLNKLSYYDLCLLRNILKKHSKLETSEDIEDLKITIESMIVYYHVDKD